MLEELDMVQEELVAFCSLIKENFPTTLSLCLSLCLSTKLLKAHCLSNRQNQLLPPWKQVCGDEPVEKVQRKYRNQRK